MAKVLVTGFEPFGGDSVNPALEAVKLLPSTIEGAQVVVREVPTAFARSAQVLEELIDAEKPDLVLCVGQAGGRAAMSVERVAINLIDARIPDNDGDQPLDTPVREDGPDAYFATLPVKAMVKAMHEAGVPAALSYSAGTYVCNSLMYNALYLAERAPKPVRAGFVHVPFATEQAVDRPASTPTMDISCITRALEAGIGAMVTADKDIHVFMGTIS